MGMAEHTPTHSNESCVCAGASPPPTHFAPHLLQQREGRGGRHPQHGARVHCRAARGGASAGGRAVPPGVRPRRWRGAAAAATAAAAPVAPAAAVAARKHAAGCGPAALRRLHNAACPYRWGRWVRCPGAHRGRQVLRPKEGATTAAAATSSPSPCQA